MKALCSLKKNKGFSLVELVTVIIVVGILSAGVTKFIQFGTQIFVDTSSRDELLSSARFLIERLNRELRTALPNSARTKEGGGFQCLEYTPITVSTIYIDIPVAPENASDELEVIKFDNNASRYNTGLRVAVYTLTSNDVYVATNKVYDLDDDATKDTRVGDVWTVTLDSAITFAADSPSKRLYFIESAISYCIEGTQMFRYQNYAGYVGDLPNMASPAKKMLMADNIYKVDGEFPFSVAAATQYRNSTVLAKLKFSLNNEDIYFNNEIQVPNVP